jgi:beta-N-acetylhexosaminidase
MAPSPLATIFGCQGPVLTREERELFRAASPLGFILFGRNIVDPAQVKALVTELRASVDRPDAPVLIDQEGGRVARLKPPHWRAAPPAGKIGALVSTGGVDAACEAIRLNSRLIADELAALGIDVDCAPVADVPIAGAHDIIGDRAYSRDPALVGTLARAAAQGLLDGGVLPVMKHIPGHGRALADSHAELPVVKESRAMLESSDFMPFRALADLPWAMTAHVLYTAIDAERPATTSPRIIAEVIRGHIGFQGVLVSDDLSMEAIKGDLPGRARAALAAGCDVALHCTGNLAEMTALAGVVPPLSSAAIARVKRGRAMLPARSTFDRAAALRRFDDLMAASA